MISFTKTEIIIEDEEDIDRQIDLDWWIARCQYFIDNTREKHIIYFVDESDLTFTKKYDTL